jgi:uncharacterized protein
MVDMLLHRPDGHLYIRSLSETKIQVVDQWHHGSLILSATGLQTDWPPACVDDLLEEHFNPIYALSPDVVLLGTGSNQVFPPPSVMAGFHQRGLGVEIMTTRAACRTFNILVSESRHVVAALMPLDNEKD